MKLSETPFVHPTATVSDSVLGRYTEIGEGCSVSHSSLGDYSYCVENTQIAYAIKVMNERGIVRSGDALRLGVGAMTDERWKSFYETMAATGVFPTGLDIRKAYSLEFINTGIGA